ncbi:MAG: efflux RND transporter periplasmic adaptor subunit [Geobacteraceae bacterium]|nr:efflux RND transporter periplasmic adaptor subunit [Geobacteraceae bacterium]
MKRFPAIALLILVGGTLTAAGCGAKGKEEGARQAPPVVQGVAVARVQAEAIPELLEAVGTVRARNSAVIAARIAGTVTAIHAREGDRVTRGKLLLNLEAAENTAGAAQARGAVAEAERGVEEAQARKTLAEATFDRYRRLLAEQAVTRQEFENRQMEREVAAQGVARAEARLSQAREGARAAGTIAGYGSVTAPISGIVTGRTAELGMTVFPGAPLLTVEEEGHYRLELAAPETLSGRVKPGDQVMVAIDGLAVAQQGRVAEVVPMVEPASRTFTVKVDLNAAGLRSGMFGRAGFPVGTREGLLVAKGAIVERGALTSVWVVDQDNIARMRLVRPGRTIGGRVEVLSGLSAGERIVTGGVELVADGARIE